MNDIQPNPDAQPERVPSVDLHQRYHEQAAPAAQSATPVFEATRTAAQPSAVPAADPAPAPPVTREVHHAVDHSLRSIKIGLLLLTLFFAAATVFFISQTLKPGDTNTPAAAPSETSNEGTGLTNPISCLSETGADATTTSKSFVDMEGTECNYKTGPKEETLVLNGKLSGRNTEGTGMSVTMSVNGKDCNGGESLNYARTYTPMASSCVFTVPANTSAAIKWRFLSPFGGTAAVLRSNKNIAPFISGIAIPKTDDRQ